MRIEKNLGRIAHLSKHYTFESHFKISCWQTFENSLYDGVDNYDDDDDGENIDNLRKYIHIGDGNQIMIQFISFIF